MNEKIISDAELKAIKKWEKENTLTASFLQKECLNSWQYFQEVREILLCDKRKVLCHKSKITRPKKDKC